MQAKRDDAEPRRAWTPSGIVFAIVAAVLLYALSSGPAAMLNDKGPRYYPAAEDGYLDGTFAPRFIHTDDRTRWMEPFATLYLPLVWLKERLPTSNPLVWYWDRFAQDWQDPPGLI